MPAIRKTRLNREESKLQTRARLLESAAQSFSRNGYIGASVDLIAEEAGHSKGAFYSNFESKDEIFLELMESFYRREVTSLWEILEKNAAPTTLLLKIKGFYSRLEEEIDWGILSAEFQMQAGRDATFAKRFGVSFNAHRDALAKLLRDLYGRFDQSVPMDSKKLANLLRGMPVGLALQRVGIANAPRRGFLGDAILFVLRDAQL